MVELYRLESRLLAASARCSMSGDSLRASCYARQASAVREEGRHWEVLRYQPPLFMVVSFCLLIACVNVSCGFGVAVLAAALMKKTLPRHWVEEFVERDSTRAFGRKALKMDGCQERNLKRLIWV